ncbi:MAG: helix-turn-helix domain-containing protein [Ruminococcaceae bacterium]|nr:helix-turn-helix domain-containing protein [Oscillospiraceae bacterium]
MMKVNYYPPIDRMQTLPFYFGGIGVGHHQEEIVRPAGSSEPELHYTVSGCGILEYAGKRQLLPAGTMFYLPRRIPHRYYAAPGGWVVNWVTYRMQETNMPSMLAFGDDILIFRPSAKLLAADRYESIYRLATSGSEQNRILASAKLYEFVLELAADLEDTGDRRNESARQMQAVVDYIEHSFSEKLTLAVICEACGGMSEQYLCRLFRRHTGLRPSEYINRRRMEYARSLLVHTELPVTAVAEMSGFESASYFHRLWKRFEDVSPKDYRRLHRGRYC